MVFFQCLKITSVGKRQWVDSGVVQNTNNYILGHRVLIIQSMVLVFVFFSISVELTTLCSVLAHEIF